MHDYSDRDHGNLDFRAGNFSEMVQLTAAGVCTARPSKYSDNHADTHRHVAGVIEDYLPRRAGQEYSHGSLANFGNNSSLKFHTPTSQIAVQVQTGDLTAEDTELIVNPANRHLMHGGGAAKAIAIAAGSSLVAECSEYIKYYQELPTPCLTHTTLGNLPRPLKFVIHACGPKASEYANYGACLELLQATFFNCLLYANDVLGVQSIAIPAISSGIFGVPMNIVGLAIFNALQVFDNYLVLLPCDRRKLSRIKFVNISKMATDSLIKEILTHLTANSDAYAYASHTHHTRMSIGQLTDTTAYTQSTDITRGQGQLDHPPDQSALTMLTADDNCAYSDTPRVDGSSDQKAVPGKSIFDKCADNDAVAGADTQHRLRRYKYRTPDSSATEYDSRQTATDAQYSDGVCQALTDAGAKSIDTNCTGLHEYSENKRHWLNNNSKRQQTVTLASYSSIPRTPCSVPVALIPTTTETANSHLSNYVQSVQHDEDEDGDGYMTSRPVVTSDDIILQTQHTDTNLAHMIDYLQHCQTTVKPPDTYY